MELFFKQEKNVQSLLMI